MLSTPYIPALLGSMFGDDHGPLFPDEWHLAWLDDTGQEITGPGYGRRVVPNDSATWDVDQVVTNLEPIDGGTPTGAWPTIHGVALCDPFGQIVVSGELTAPVTASQGSPVVFEAGDLTIGTA